MRMVIARAAHIPVTVDVDTIYPGFDRVLPLVDYLIASSEFPGRWTKEADSFRALEILQDEHKMPVAAMIAPGGQVRRTVTDMPPD